MRVALVLLTATLALAAPRPQDDDGISTSEDPTGIFPTITSLNTSIPITLPTLPVGNTTLPLPPNATVTEPPTTITSSAELPTTKSSRTRRPHTEPIPIFTSKCACRTMGPYPCYAYEPYNKCLFEVNYSLACFYQNGGCQYPTLKCDNIPKPGPITGRHPCDMSPPEETSSSSSSSSSSSTASVPLTVTAVPTPA